MMETIKLPEKQRITLKDVAQKAGVGIATVDRVVNGRAPVSKKTTERWQPEEPALWSFSIPVPVH